MLFDEKDLRVFENAECRAYFEEILQTYYSKNYRATIVLLYSFVIYDLYIKLQTMANEGNKKANTALKDLKDKINDEDKKYSEVENDIIQFFLDNCPLYFNRFKEDISYLKNCRNKCAHLKVDDNSLFVPNDYHARMLICSMFDNVLSVKAPFITDFFEIARTDVEKYSRSIFTISDFNDAIKIQITNTYLKRMTEDSLKKSYKTFLRMLLVSEDEHCKNYSYGLYAFSNAMTDYIIKQGYTSIFSEIIEEIINKIDIEKIKDNDSRREQLFELVKQYPRVLDIIQNHSDLFNYICKTIFMNPVDFGNYYKTFYAREQKTIYRFFLENEYLHRPIQTVGYYNALKDSPDFSFSEFLTIMMNNVPGFDGFSSADSVMNCFLNNINLLTKQNIEELMSIYDSNNQFYSRRRHDIDKNKIDEYITSSTESNEQDTNEPEF